MYKTSTWLLDYKSNVYSQTGEDGIIDKIIQVVPDHNKWCVEFGAWDGRYLSNTRNLIETKEYSAVLIEGSTEKFRELQRYYSDNKKVIPINRFVGFSREDNLDSILQHTPIPRDFDFLSIDIDGNDYHVWKAASEYQPKVICVEFNPTIPTEVEFVQPQNHLVQQGCSLLSLVKLGKQKGYELVSVLPFNAFFVRSELLPMFQIEDNSPEALRRDHSFITYMFVGYDGKIFLRGHSKLHWHSVEIRESKIQQLPRMLQKFPNNYSWIERQLFNLYQRYKEFLQIIRSLTKNLILLRHPRRLWRLLRADWRM